MGILRIDVRCDYEDQDNLFGIFSLIVPRMPEMSDCKGTITKSPIYTVESINNAVQRVGFIKSEHLLICRHNGYAYDGYWTIA